MASDALLDDLGALCPRHVIAVQAQARAAVGKFQYHHSRIRHHCPRRTMGARTSTSSTRLRLVIIRFSLTLTCSFSPYRSASARYPVQLLRASQPCVSYEYLPTFLQFTRFLFIIHLPSRRVVRERRRSGRFEASNVRPPQPFEHVSMLDVLAVVVGKKAR